MSISFLIFLSFVSSTDTVFTCLNEFSRLSLAHWGFEGVFHGALPWGSTIRSVFPPFEVNFTQFFVASLRGGMTGPPVGGVCLGGGGGWYCRRSTATPRPPPLFPLNPPLPRPLADEVAATRRWMVGWFGVCPSLLPISVLELD